MDPFEGGGACAVGTRVAPACGMISGSSAVLDALFGGTEWGERVGQGSRIRWAAASREKESALER